MGLNYDQLTQWENVSSQIYFLTSLVTDPVELILTCIALLYITLSFFCSGKEKRREVSASIFLQMALMLGQSLLFTTRDIYMGFNSIKDAYRDYLPFWVFIIFIIAEQLLILQHTLFIGQYARVAVAIPLTFCLQSEEIQRKREHQLRVVLLTEFLIAASCIT